ncbi:hypothetical protein C7M61_004427 [Candidozyma pseudohaemuli]|uniref:Ubiquitin carboxyl-terminal hydrolase n=1 Tax=Candidozyma pseudohaemuli TaxID=418784 RepID=A0A2P7YI48_9ASCO|nr:hypothetical protein C7M61_004427 [[Candida] pseudohaemulonii]PSK35638.1 hypothetical protein C7M61_004427 [[Candida] pseudohaemulonii]
MSVTDYIATAGSSFPKSVPSGTKVYKDDCMYSFDTPENNELGLDVCMSCFQAFARAPQKNYTLEHYSEQRHPLYVNIVKKLKPESERTKREEEDENGSKTKQPKLEVQEQKETDIYDIITNVYVAPLDQSASIEESPEPVRLLANLILTANSAEKNDEIKAWENEVYPCEHSSNIVAEKNTIDLKKCSMCDLEENLWLCFTCGAVGCGREQFGSDLKGNSHALKHYEDTGHSVAVKLGSLSAEDEDNCDCYCYKCNDEVKVPQLGEKLLNFGIDLGTAVKTEKNLVELNLDRNMNWQFNLDGQDGELLTPVYGPGLTGLQNLGNSCYLNSTLQALFSFPSYRSFFADLDFDKLVKDPATDLRSHMIKLYDGLHSGRYSRPNELKGDDYQLGLKPSAFKSHIGADHYEFKTNKQQDANEFLLYLLDKLDKEFGLSLNQQFKFLLGSKLLCTECKTGTSSEELVDNISVALNAEVVGEDENGKKQYKEVNMSDCFSNSLGSEQIDGYQCDNCGKKTTAIKQTGFATYPENLIVNAQRIQLENWVPVKVDVPITLPEQIDLSAFAAPKFQDDEKRVEKGSALEGGAEFAPNEEAFAQLLSMGFPDVRCIKGLYNTGNKNAEDAMNWIFAHMEDADIDAPFNPAETAQTNTAGSGEPDLDAIDNLVAMGFTAQLAKKALVVNGNDVNVAVEWLFNNPDDNGIIEDTKPVVNVQKEAEELKDALLKNVDEPHAASYELKAVICHKGNSPHTGHYVVFVKHDGDWILFNDEKVVKCQSTNLADMVNCGYVYFFAKA